jgi:hypothetical protein
VTSALLPQYNAVGLFLQIADEFLSHKKLYVCKPRAVIWISVFMQRLQFVDENLKRSPPACAPTFRLVYNTGILVY